MSIADVHQQEVSVGTHVADAERFQATHELRQSFSIEPRALLDVSRIVERGNRGRLRD